MSKVDRFAHQVKPRLASRTRGFTLFELMITIAVAAVIAGFAVPSFVNIVRANRIVTDNNELVSALALARSEAIRSGLRTTVCRSADQATCAANGGWEQGWIVFTDPTGAGTVDGGEEILRVWDPLDGGTTITPAPAFTSYVSFVGSGETRGSAANRGTFSVCGKTNDVNEGRTISVGLIGYTSTQKGVAACP
ncbi:MAG: GspH/FimT family pseudopilin [Woeseiaceae bacterium]